MAERKLEIVFARDGADTVVQSFPLAPKDVVRLHSPDADTFRAVVRHPRDAYDKFEREKRPGEVEVFHGDEAVAAAKETADASAAEDAVVEKETSSPPGQAPAGAPTVESTSDTTKPTSESTRKTTAKKTTRKSTRKSTAKK